MVGYTFLLCSHGGLVLPDVHNGGLVLPDVHNGSYSLLL